MAKAQNAINTVYVAIYLRLSRDDQNGSAESMSISNQRDMLINYCDERAWKVYDIYVDDGFTGTNYDRPAFKRMIEDIESGHINVVLTKDLSRLGRNYVMTGQYTDFFFPEHGVRYVAVNDSYDSDKDDNDIAPFKNILNEMYAKDISKKVRSVRNTSAKQGKFMGSKPPFGYVKSSENKHQLVVDPLAAEIVKRLFREFASGESGRNIASKLNVEGVDTPAVYYFKQTGKRSTRSDSCNQWGSATVIQLLRNQVYIGDMVQCKRKVSSFKTKKRLVTSQDDWVIVEDTHEALIDDFTWERVQHRLETTRKAPSNHGIKTNSTDEVNLFSGIIRCADCGAAMAFNRKVRTDGGERLFYRCSRYANNGKNACTMHKIDVEVLEAVILHDIQQHANAAIQDEGPLLGRLLAFSGEACKSESAAREKSLRDATSRISFIETATKQLFEEKVIGNVPDSLFKKMLADYEREIAELTETSIELRRHIQESRDNRADVKRWLSLMKECATIDKLDRATAYQLIDSVAVQELADECGIKTQTVQIKYNFVGCIS
ncbi:recombinase family protein [Oscillospiraceae bacterium OttesenSCG-928-G22]|nr:recombinase family protein [Oscillospiraceae bacterium OttesenSCG-928-G22]